MLDSENNSLSFGRYLQAIRLENKQSLEEVAKKTRVGLGNLLLIEQEDHDRLPAEVFVKGFIRAYAGAIGADANEAVRRYEYRLDVVQKIADSEAASARGSSKLIWQLMIATGLFGCIIVASIYGTSYFQDQPSGKPPTTQPAPIEKEQPPPGPTQAQSETSGKPEGAKPQKMKLRVAAREETWLKVIIDEDDPKEFKLVPGENLEFEAASGYNILIGNAGGVDLTLNGKPIPIPGESGQVVTLQLP